MVRLYCWGLPATELVIRKTPFPDELVPKKLTEFAKDWFASIIKINVKR